MTEPPQPPPNQPPPPSGYGHLPGPPQPGYVPPPGENPYARQPVTAPQQHVPQHPSHQQFPQPGYGYPPPPPGAPQGLPGAPGGPGGPGNRKRVVVIAAAVAAALVLGTGAYFAFGRDGGDVPRPPVAQGSASADDKPSGSPSADTGDGSGTGAGDHEDFNAGRAPGEDKVLWYKSAKIDGPGAGIPAKGQWVVGDFVVKAVGKSLVGYQVTDGKQKWKLDLPSDICGTTDQTTGDGKTAVLLKQDDSATADCNQLKLVDLKSGKEGWTKTVEQQNLFDTAITAYPSIVGDTVTVNRLISSTAYKISTGDKLFTGNVPEGCKPHAYVGGGTKMIGIATCEDADRTVEVQGVDPATGKKGWTYRLPKGFTVSSVYSVDPLVIDVGNRDTKERAVLSLGPDGQKRASMSAEGSFSVCPGGDEGRQGCGTSAVADDTLYLATASATGGKSNEIVAFDLGSGKAKWRTPSGDNTVLAPLGAENGRLIAYRKSLSSDKGGEIVAVPAAGGSPTVLLHNPSGAASKVESAFYSPELDYVDGRFFLSVTRLQADGKDEKLLMAFGK
ncbi:PQQ-binding-like beta-propeller repeat protein [Streptomyces sp. NPDC051130]|uniref:outer membrane protein assembly factor BamB family protein n=1 Tax=Streptomyces sp. NPDC051130 TaxID=3157223 RepID=UPI0034391DB5